MSDSLSKSLSRFISNGNNSFDGPYDYNTDNDEGYADDVISAKSFIEQNDERKKERKENKKKKDKFDRVLEKGRRLMEDLSDDDVADDFDRSIEGLMLEDDDDELRKTLVSYGRKYARDTKTTEGASEIQKTYAASEKMLNDLIDELEKDSNDVQKDISQMRALRSRNYKTMSELIQTRTTIHNTKLSAIKEMNAMKKNQIELQMKVDKTKNEEQTDDTVVNRTIQGLFSMGRDSIVSSYASVSGSEEA